MFVIYDHDQVLGEDAMKAGSGLGLIQMETGENHVES
jgi:hypothetical protein